MNRGRDISFSGRRLGLVEGNLLENTVPLLTGILPRDSLSGAVSVASGTASPFTPGQAEVRWLTLREEEDGFLAGRWPMLLCPLLSGCKHAQITTIQSWRLIIIPGKQPGNSSSFLHQPESRQYYLPRLFTKKYILDLVGLHVKITNLVEYL